MFNVVRLSIGRHNSQNALLLSFFCTDTPATDTNNGGRIQEGSNRAGGRDEGKEVRKEGEIRPKSGE